MTMLEKYTTAVVFADLQRLLKNVNALVRALDVLIGAYYKLLWQSFYESLAIGLFKMSLLKSGLESRI